ncbi:MAG: efflux RND transporter periplasmic adaptor subunit [Chloroflexi bacterium]|nr:efflux RND transporter periplasmic adaptor subunit [Chloroflexota bacterium]
MPSNQPPARSKGPRINRGLLAGIIVIVLMIATALVISNPPGRANAQAQGPATVAVSRGKIIGSVDGNGTVSAEQTTDLVFQGTGIVKSVMVEAGDTVKAGQVLAELDMSELQLALANAQAALNLQQARYDQVKAGATDYDLAAAQAGLDSAQAGYEAAVRKAGVNDSQLQVARASLDKAAIALQKAKADYDTAVSDGKTDLTLVGAARQQAQVDYESAQANYTITAAGINDSAVRSAASSVASAKANLLKLQSSPTTQDGQAAQAQLEQAKIAVQQAQVRLRNTQLIAPFGGIVTVINITQGSSATGAVAAVRLMDRSQLHVKLKLSENDVVKVQTGMPVDLTIDSLAGWIERGRISYIAPASDVSNGVVTYAVRVIFADGSARVKVGMTANLSIITAEKDGVLLVPNAALLPKGSRHIVQVLDANGKTRDIDVETGISDGAHTEIISGLSEGMRILALPGNVTRPASPFGGG